MHHPPSAVTEWITSMVMIRRAQMTAFQDAALRDFERRMVLHLSQTFPAVCEPLGDAGVRESIQYGMQRAGSYGIAAERDVCKYIDLMFVFGRDFDKDPSLPWAAGILHDDDLGDASKRMEALSDAGLAHLHAAAATGEPGKQP